MLLSQMRMRLRSNAKDQNQAQGPHQDVLQSVEGLVEELEDNHE